MPAVHVVIPVFWHSAIYLETETPTPIGTILTSATTFILFTVINVYDRLIITNLKELS